MEKIEFENIILRDMIETDIEDYVRWFTTETQWSKSDTPWEPVDSDEETERKGWMEYYNSVKDLPENVRRWKFEIQYNSRHVGWICSYMIDENYEWIAGDAVQPGQTVFCAIGIDICEPDAWGKGIGTAAMQAFIDYCFDKGATELYTQTWSGHIAMIRCAGKLGFVECQRCVGQRQAEGKSYDALTFRLKK